jgi:hypothetical protein
LIDASNTFSNTLNEKTAANGTISVDLLSSGSGGMTVSAVGVDPVSTAQMSTSLSLTLVGPPASFSVTPTTPIPVGGTSLITVIVSDAVTTHLSGIPVHFAVEQGKGAGTFSKTTVNTGNIGQAEIGAQTLYLANDPNGTNVVIDVTVPPLAVQTTTIKVGL